MKKIYTSILYLFVFIASCNVTQTNDGTSTGDLSERFRVMLQSAQDENIAQKTKDNLKKSAEILAYRYILESNPSQIEIDAELIDLFYAGLVHIRNSEEGEPVSSISARGNIVIHELIIAFDENGPIAKNWKEGVKETGVESLDNLLAEFDMELGIIGIRNDFGVLVSERPYNMNALAKKFSNLSQINYAEPNGIVGDGSDINAEVGENELIYIFKSGAGDCPAGCISEHFWKFSVSQTGEVKLVAEFGDPLSG